ncbi:MAG: galactokinase [bacterium]
MAPPQANGRRRALDGFAREYGGAPEWLVRSPGRANLIGEHTDYNDGFALPAAIDLSVWIALRPCAGRVVRVRSLDVRGDPLAVSLDATTHVSTGWGAHVAGVVMDLRRRGLPLRAWEGVVASDLPMGAGLASSASLAVAVVSASGAACGVPISGVDRALSAWRAEVESVGVRCGVMDQLAVSCGVADHALLIDCRTFSSAPVPIPSGCAMLLLDTGVRRDLSSSAYNLRREQCEVAAARLGAAALRDVTPAVLDRRRGDLDATSYRRARHVVSENARVREAVDAMRRGDLVALGRVVNASHESLRDDFEVSCAELDAMVRSVREEPACLGARMMGAGFGGTVLALIAVDSAETAADVAGARSLARYAAATGRLPASHVVRAADGAHVIDAPLSAGD